MMSSPFTSLYPLILILCGCILCGEGTLVLPLDTVTILDPQNAERQRYGLAAFIYDNNLQTVAQQQTEQCVFSPGSPSALASSYQALSGTPATGLGQNLGAATPGYLSIANWINQKNNWACATDTCSAGDPKCDNYRQIVWSTSVRIGCSVSRCSVNSPLGAGSWDNLLCLYYDAGNMIFNGVRQRPFPVSQCSVTPSPTPATTPSPPASTPATTPSPPGSTPASTPATTPSPPGSTPASTPATTPSPPASTPATTPSPPGSTPATTPSPPGSTPATTPSPPPTDTPTSTPTSTPPTNPPTDPPTTNPPSSTPTDPPTTNPPSSNPPTSPPSSNPPTSPPSSNPPTRPPSSTLPPSNSTELNTGDTSSPGSLPTWAIAIIVVAAIVVMIVIAVAIVIGTRSTSEVV